MVQAGARGRYRAGVQRQAEIVAAAVEVFANRGYRAGTIKEIADIVGITPAAVLRYFSKDELLTEVLRHWNVQQRWVTERGGGLAYFLALKELMRYHVEHRGYLELYLTFAVESSDAQHPAHRFMFERFGSSIATMRRNLREAARLGEIAEMNEAATAYEASCLYAILDGLEVQWLLNPEVDLVGLVGEYIDQAIERWRGGVRVGVGISGSDSWQ